jgi:glucose-6-phosphate 1-dehydrogenase
MSDIDVIVLFGATGDLAAKMLFPALYRLEEQGAIDQRIIGIALDEWDTERFASHVAYAVTAAVPDVDADVRDRLVARLSYVAGNYAEAETFTRLVTATGEAARCLHYLAIPPKLFEAVVSGLEGAGLMSHSRVLVEKPFGRDLETARHLNGVLHHGVAEESIFRIDHFLGKEPVENLLAFRYANPIFDAVWNRHYIDHIQLTMAETFGIDQRGALYETLGVVRDVVQNHLLQVLCLLTMEAPVSPRADSFADERAKVLTATRSLTADDIVYGQYDGYRDSDHVAADSRVATFAALRLAIDTPRWYGVPIYVRAGKGMATTATQAVVVFRESPPLPFSPQPGVPEANRLVFRIGPDDGVDLLVQTKRPGEGVRLATTPLKVDYDRLFGRIPFAYERVLHDALTGDRSLFAREDAVEEAWRIVDAIADPPTGPETYPQGSWGPAGAAGLIGPGRSWIDP